MSVLCRQQELIQGLSCVVDQNAPDAPQLENILINTSKTPLELSRNIGLSLKKLAKSDLVHTTRKKAN